MSNFTLTHLESRVSGDIAYDAGTYQQTITPTVGAGMAETRQGRRDPRAQRQRLERLEPLWPRRMLMPPETEWRTRFTTATSRLRRHPK